MKIVRNPRSLAFQMLVLLVLWAGAAWPHVPQAHADPALRRVVNNTHPLNMIGFYYSDSSNLPQLWNSIPANQKPYSTILLIAENSLNNTATVKNWITARLDECQAGQMSCMVQAINGETKKSLAIPVSWFESLMQNYTSLIGFNAAELYNSIPFYGQTEGDHSQYVADLLNMAANYGGLFVWSDTNIFSANGTLLDWIQNNSNLIAAMRAHKDNFSMIYKQSYTDNSTEGLSLGLFLSGLAGNWGISSDWWHWQLAGYGQLFGGWNGANGDWKQIFTYPEAMYVQDLIRVASEGGTVFKSEAGWYSTSNQGRLTPGYVHAALPFLDKVINGSIHIPTRAEVLAKNKFAYVGKPAWSVPYMSNYSGIYMKTGRYGIIPLLPTNANAAELANFENTSTTPKDEAYFQSLYPSETYASNTFASRNGSTWYWMNSSENTDVYQSSKLMPKTNPSTYFYIGANPHTYAVVTESATQFKVHLNNYRVDKSAIYNGTSWSKAGVNDYIYNTYSVNPNDDTLRTSVIKVNGAYDGGSPQLTITGDNGYSYTQQWDAANKEFTLTVQHNGPVDIVIGANQAGAGTANPPVAIEGESGTLAGTACSCSMATASGGKYVGELGNSATSAVTLQAYVDQPGYYRMDVTSIVSGTRNYMISVNGRVGRQLAVSGSSWTQPAASVPIDIYLDAGRNTIKFYNNTAWAPSLDKVVLSPSASAIPGIEAESGTLSGTAVLMNIAAASGGKVVGNVGNGAANYVTLSASVPTAGSYRLNIYGIVSGTRTLYASVNGGAGQSVNASGSSWTAVAPVVSLDVNLNAGANAIKLYNDTAYTPGIDKIEIVP
ncbi:glycosyl hydrolase family 98 C-terminal domain-containing protein [Cohnella sp. JJ-181]|uniref:glycosyl hydrolase family 98 C-terminal domain-containing protein n=1 Tax=Cohnella rhizoplanae TaxID=2974897 RepID=UPI0022FF86C6|nr:glycosyl hydrolase family 98 C-terminal domain-containing protein [Cohnella sp. JJ-181]CAI6039855.1 hypothetical protein COHCIP112018_01041 [Cohnella sp. JJ-181]